MSKHKNLRSSNTALLAFIFGLSSIGLSPGIVNASGLIGCTAPEGAAARTLQEGSICEIRFTAVGAPVTQNTWQYTVPDGVTRVSALLVGAGGKPFRSDDGSAAAAGGGGEVTFISNLFNLSSDSSSRTFNITAGYADTEGSSLIVDRTVKVASTGPISLVDVPSTIDGVELEAGDRVLVKNQENQTENGIYRVDVGGETWSRAPFYETAEYINLGDIVQVENGTQYPIWRLTTEVDTLGTDPLVWVANWSMADGKTEVERQDGGSYVAGAGFRGQQILNEIVGGQSGGQGANEGPYGGEGEIVVDNYAIATGGGDSGPGLFALSPSTNLLGGQGTTLEDASPRREEHLWADWQSEEFNVFGAGGSYFHNLTLETYADNSPTSPNHGYGVGGNIGQVVGEGSFLFGDYGSNGTAIIRFFRYPTPTVTFMPNGGEGTMPQQSSETDVALSANTFTREGYTFVGWNTDPLGESGDGYGPGALYSFEEEGSDFLYAQWIPAGSFLFNKGEHKKGNQQPVVQTTRIQPLFEPGGFNLGNDLEINDYIDFYDVTTVDINGSAVSVGARVTFLSHYGSTGNSSTPNELDKLDGIAEMDDSENNYLLKAELDFDTSQDEGDAFVEVSIAFYRDLSSANLLTVNPPTPITLTNVQLSLYDLDFSQFVGIEGDNYRIFLSEESHVQVNDEKTRFPYRTFTSPNQGTSDEESFTIGRATILFSSVQEFNLMMGIKREAILADMDSEQEATFLLDFGPGLPWGGGDEVPVEYSEESDPSSEEEELPARNSNSQLTGPVVSYVAPIISRISPSCVGATQANQSVTLEGSAFSGVTAASVAGNAAAISSRTENSLTLELPSLAVGNYDLTLFLKNAGFVYQEEIKVCSTPKTDSVAGQLLPFKVSKRFIGYRGDLGPVSARDRTAIVNFIRSNPGLTSVTCVGSTSGVPAKASDTSLARARAQNACRVVRTLLPNATIRIGTSVGRGVGQFFRAVTITGNGTKSN